MKYDVSFLCQNKSTPQPCQHSLIEEFFEPFHLEAYRGLTSPHAVRSLGETTGFVERH
jgi:hypothetical protein